MAGTIGIDAPRFDVGARRFKDRGEYHEWLEIRSAGFSPWYVESEPSRRGPWARYAANAEAALFPDFHLQLRDDAGHPVGYLKTVPTYWSGEPSSLHTYEYVNEALTIGSPTKRAAVVWSYTLLVEWLGQEALWEQLAQRIRRQKMDGANAICLLAMAVDPAARGQGLPGLLMQRAKDAAAHLGYRYVISPFRPTAYGAYKAERGLAHSRDLFAEYCAATRPDGKPLDPWLRRTVALGARLVRPVDRSFVIHGTLERFDALRETYRPDDWYSPATDVWECGETCTWYVDRARNSAMSVEPNCWGVIDIEPEGAGSRRPAA